MRVQGSVQWSGDPVQNSSLYSCLLSQKLGDISTFYYLFHFFRQVKLLYLYHAHVWTWAFVCTAEKGAADSLGSVENRIGCLHYASCYRESNSAGTRLRRWDPRQFKGSISMRPSVRKPRGDETTSRSENFAHMRWGGSILI